MFECIMGLEAWCVCMYVLLHVCCSVCACLHEPCSNLLNSCLALHQLSAGLAPRHGSAEGSVNQSSATVAVHLETDSGLLSGT